MPSYTSNSSRAPLSLFAKVGVGIVLLMTTYNGYIALAKPRVEITFDAGSENRIIAERYLYGDTPAAVMVGSSLGRTLTAALPASTYNMSFSGDGPLTGLEAVLRREPAPPVIIVETNVLERPRNDAFIHELFASPFGQLRKFVPAFRTEYRPLHIAITLFDELYAAGRSAKALLRRASPPDAPLSAENNDPNDPRLAYGLKQQLDTNAVVTPSHREKIAQHIEILAEQTTRLHSKDACVVLVHLPLHPDVEATALQRYIDDRLKERFPAENWSWIDIRNDGSYHTVDSIHLTVGSAARTADMITDRVGTLCAGSQTRPIQSGR